MRCGIVQAHQFKRIAMLITAECLQLDYIGRLCDDWTHHKLGILTLAEIESLRQTCSTQKELIQKKLSCDEEALANWLLLAQYIDYTKSHPERDVSYGPHQDPARQGWLHVQEIFMSDQLTASYYTIASTPCKGAKNKFRLCRRSLMLDAWS